ncbi:hypothetical protein AAE478_008642 [Parahypoxylon ruwenzoriense]
MEASQGTQPQEAQPSPLSEMSHPPHSPAHHGRPATMPFIDRPLHIPPHFMESYREAFQAIQRQYRQDQTQGNPIVDPVSPFPQFRKLPTEIRLKIWRGTWEHRNVGFTRRIMGFRQKQATGFFLNDGDFDFARIMRTHQVYMTRQEWTDQEMPPDTMPYQLVTYTRGMSKLPVSLWVNQESRSETLEHFKIAFAMPGGRSNVYFHFGLDILKFPLHSPLSTAFPVPDLRLLTRLCIPELVPAVPSFAETTGEWDEEVDRILPRIDDEDDAVPYHEFKYVWRLLRRWFPSLREIRLEPFYSCKHYTTTRQQNMSEPLEINFDADVTLESADKYCCSCLNIQSGLGTRFQSISRQAAYDGPTMLERVLDHHNIIRPIYKDETLLIGKVLHEQRSKEECVTVTYRAIYDGDEHLEGGFNPAATQTDWEVVRRKCVARTLEHALGPPIGGEYMVYKM